MKLNVSYPANGSQKLIEVDDERKLRPFMEKRMGSEVRLFIYHTKENTCRLRVFLSVESDWQFLGG